MTTISDSDAQLGLDLSKIIRQLFLAKETKPYLNLSVLALVVSEQMVQAGVTPEKIDKATAHFGEQVRHMYDRWTERG